MMGRSWLLRMFAKCVVAGEVQDARDGDENRIVRAPTEKRDGMTRWEGVWLQLILAFALGSGGRL